MPVEIIAEIGLNHNGSLDEAKRLVDAAKAAGADTAKFQASHVDDEVSRRYEDAHHAMIANLLLTFDDLAELKQHCAQAGIEFLCTPADIRSIDELVAMKVKRLKIASDNITNAQFLKHAADKYLPLILSTGMATMAEIDAAADYTGWHNLTMLQCTSAYPCPMSDVNLSAMADMAARFPADAFGLSDHTTSWILPAVAVGMGATVIEKHFTLNTMAEGPDHRASLDRQSFAFMVQYVREAEAALGDGNKRLMPSEEVNHRAMRKSLMAARPVRKGETFTAANLTAKRPGWGRSPMDYYAVLGTVAARDYDPDEMVD